MKNSLYKCQTCKSEFDFKNIRYGPDGKTIFCVGCFCKLRNKEAEKTNIRQSQITDNSEKIKVICIDCRYKFSLTKGSRIKPLCPYCGKGNLMKDGTTAEKLVEEASKLTDRELVSYAKKAY